MRGSSAITPELVAEIAKLVRLGSPMGRAAEANGIPDATASDWFKRGRDQTGGLYHDFAEAITQARGTFVSHHLAVITRAAQEGTWQASAWLLERTHPEYFSRRERVTHETEPGRPLEVITVDAIDAEIARIAAELGRAPGTPGGAKGAEAGRADAAAAVDA